MNISIVSASGCLELTFAVENQKQTVRKPAAIYTQLSFHTCTSPTIQTHTHAHKHTHAHTHIQLQAVQSGARHILKKEKDKNGLIYMCILFVQ